MNNKSKTIITCFSWVMKGFAKSIPIEYQEAPEDVKTLNEVKGLETSLKKYII